ncbi:MAG: SatD family protein [Candidatus Dadabacteria bacterium]|nr:SatD family protein [Candidatus Dadabacteria bacterium]
MDNHIYTVVTGDIVGSTNLSLDSREGLYKSLKQTAQAVYQNFNSVVPHPPVTFSGDSWQLLVDKPEAAFRIALYFRALIIAESTRQRIDTRFSIGFGRIDFIPEGDISGGDGEAYRLSGKSLKSLKKPERIVVDFPDAMKSELTEALGVILKLVDLQVSKWTASQAQAVCGAMLDMTQHQVAIEWPGKQITQQAVAQHLGRAKWDYILESIKIFEKLVKIIIQRY